MAPQVGILGYGRFGQALATLLDDASFDFLAVDPATTIPEHRKAVSLSELCARSEILVLAVPVAAMRAAITAILPHIRADQLILDVGSVKVTPVRILAELVGSSVPWIGSHPLFGPMSLALAERPLRVVICPNAMHPQACARARNFYESIGCEVVLQSPEEHDRVMAHTHALTFFVAKGMIDAGAGLDVPFAPPSFQAFSRTIETVRSDAGHLFSAIQRENPFAKEARKHLLQALISIDEAVEQSSSTGDAPSLAIPDAPARSPALDEAREAIDGIDHAIVALLARRTELARRAAKAKADMGLPVLDASREAHVIEVRRAWARDLAIDETSLEEVFHAVMRLSRRSQRGIK